MGQSHGPPDAERRPPARAAVQDRHRHAQVGGDGTGSVATTSRTSGDLPRYQTMRELVLGRRLTIPEDESAAAETLSALFGGPRRAASWLRSVLAQVDTLGRRT